MHFVEMVVEPSGFNLFLCVTLNINPLGFLFFFSRVRAVLSDRID